MKTRRQFIAAAGATAAAFALPAIRRAEAAAPQGWRMPSEWAPTVVRIGSDTPAGQIHVVPQTFQLYLSLGNRRAIRYKVGIGKGNLYEPGQFFLGAKKEWPTWRPTDEMIARSPQKYAKYANGMPGGPENPLGSRALYLFTPQKGDTFLRIHGTTEPWTIGTAVSNGCVRLANMHVEDLYARAVMGAPIFLHRKSEGA